MIKRVVSILLILALLPCLICCAVKPAEGAYSRSCFITIECKQILEHLDEFNEDKLEVLPEDGVILERVEAGFNEGESVYDILRRVTAERHVHMEASYTPVYNSAYVEGINNIYEFDCGALSGWTYSVNGVFPHYGCSAYYPEDGDEILWHYTCEYMPELEG